MPHIYIVACFIPLDDAQMPKFKPKPRTFGGNCHLNFSQVTKEISTISLFHRSPWKRLVEVIALVLVTSSIWFTVAYMSPCRQLPGKASTLSGSPATCSAHHIVTSNYAPAFVP